MLAKVAHNNSKADKRASLVASKAKWSRVDEQPTPRLSADGRAGNYKQDSVQQWLMSSCQEQVKSDPDLDASEPLKRQASGEDDLVLGVEASLYGRNPELKTAEEVPRSPQAVPPLTRWNSLTSAVSAQSGALSVMDVLNLWHDDPEELLLELGFGSEEPDISARIPARFINHQSKAQGISIQVFLEAHKNRLDLENPDVSSRFRQLEVLQQVTSAFSALVPATPPTPAPAVKLSPASRERRRRLGMLFRRASKKTLSMNQGQQSPPADPSANQEPDLSDRRPALKHSRPGPPENAGLTPLVEEQSPNASQDACDPPAAGPPPLPGESPRPQLRRDPPCITPRSPLRRKSPGDMKSPESFEIEEIHSFDEGSAVRSAAELGESAEARFLRTSSCQSDSSGFLEEPFIPCLSQQASPVPELLKALHNLSGDSTDSQITVKESTDIPYRMDSPTSVKEMTDIPNRMDSPTTVKESTDIHYKMDSPTSVKEMADIPNRMDSPTTVKESTDIPFSMDSPTTVKESTDIPYRMDGRTSVKEMADISNGMDSPTNVKESTDIPYRMDSPTSIKESADMPYRMDSPTTVKESADIPYRMDNPTTVKESTDIPYRMDSPTTVKEMADIPNRMDSPTTVKESTDILYKMDNPTTVKEMADIPYRMDSPKTVKEIADIPYSMDSQLTVKESTDIPYSMDSPKTVKEIVDIPYSMDSPTTVKESANVPYRMDSQLTVKESAGIPFITDSQTIVKGNVDISYSKDIHKTVEYSCDVPNNTGSSITVKERADIPSNYSLITVNKCADIPYIMNTSITVNAYADVPYSTDSPIALIDCADIPYKYSMIIVNDSADIPNGMDSHITVKESADIPYRMDSSITVKESSDIPYNTENWICVNEVSDLPCNMDSEGLEKKKLDLPYRTESGISLKEDSGIPFVSDSRSLLKENSSQGAADSPQTAGLETDETTDREELENSQNPVVQMKTGPVPSQTHDDGEDRGAPRASFGEIKTGSRVKESASPEEEESLLCSKSKNSLQPQGGIVARRGGSEWAQGWLEESTDAAFPHREESETDVGAESFRPDWASFGSSKSVSVQMRSSLPSVSQTTRRGCPAPTPNLRREIAEAMAAAATSSRGQGRKLSQGKPRKRSASLDTGRTWEEEEEEGEEEVGRWEAGMIAGTRCCCVCDHRCSCCSWHTHHPTGEHTSAGLPLLHQSASRSSPFTFSLDELEGMVRCMRRFRGVLEDVEEQLQEQEAQVYSDFSHLDRADAASVRALRAEVKREAELLETQLTELAQHCDAGITTKMQRLLDEQSQLCMQLRLPSEARHWGPAHGRQATPPGPVSAMPGYLSGRCVATQCCLLPDLLVSGSSLSADLLPGTQCPSPPPEGALTPARATTATRRNPPNKQDVLAFAGFFQSLKDSLRHSVHSDCLE
ncbi:protein ITPRID1 [Anguilla rostrata]|uniref:protein ITPRID1 n=1 Tax=Anguilla rostrata TaxID=7938 RepID=UPI0030D3710E